MKLITRNIKGLYYTEYPVKTGETLKQIARDLLHNENLTTEIYRLNNNALDIKPIDAAQNLSGWVLLVPPVPASILAGRQAASQKLAEIKDSADKGILSAEDYYAQRKLIFSVL